MKYVLIILLFISTAVSAQVIQERNSNGADRRLITKLGFRVPLVCGFPSLPDLLNYTGDSARGAMVFDTCSLNLLVWTDTSWSILGNAGTDTTIFDFVIDSTGQSANRVLFAGGNKIRSDNFFLYDSVNNKLVVNHQNISVGGPSTKLWVQGNAKVTALTTTTDLTVEGLTDVYDTTTYKPAVANSSGVIERLAYWPVGSGSGGDYVDTIYRKAGQDSIFFTINGGAERAIKDSTGAGGSGVPIDSVAIRRIGEHYVGWNSGFGSTGTNGGSDPDNIDANFFAMSGAGNAITSGIRNVGIGNNALNALTTGNNNFAMGRGALGLLQGGALNVALGEGTLGANVSGDRNTAIGTFALDAFLGGSSVAIGDDALGASNSSSATAYNVGVGRGAGGSITSGTLNTFVGGLSGRDQTTGGGNVAIGYGAGRGVLGNNNVAIGSNTGANVETMRGTGNALSVAVGSSTMLFNNMSNATFLGAEAGRGASGTPHTGQYNNGLGYRANYDVGGAVTGASNTVIGDRIALSSRTSSNQFVWGVNGVNYLTRFTGGGWLVNYTTSAVTTQTASTALEVNGTTGAVLFPRLTTTQRDALTATNGMVIYNTTTDKLQVYAAATWVDLH